jgi:hypothetical protein
MPGKLYCWILNIWHKKLAKVGLVGNKKPAEAGSFVVLLI